LGLYVVLTLVMILGSCNPSDMPFDYQIR